MSSSPSSSSPSSSSSSPSISSEHHNGSRSSSGPDPTQTTDSDYDEPPSSYPGVRSHTDVWPEPFVEALAAQVAIDASRSTGRLAAATALANIFQVCSTLRAVSRSELLWHRLTRRVWRRSVLMHATWRDEYIYWHRTARNFRTGRSTYTMLRFVSDNHTNNDPDSLLCRCLTLSDFHLACGFVDGAVRLFDLNTYAQVTTFRPNQQIQLGQFSRAVSGIVISNSRLVFATLDGDIYVAAMNGQPQTRQAREGDLVTNGVLVDFAGCGRWWVGLFAGVPGRSFHIWDAHREEPVFVGGSLTDPESLMGWHMLTELPELTEFVGRVRVTRESAMACTSGRLILFNARDQGIVLGEEESRRGIIATSLDVSHEAYIIVDVRGVASVRRVNTLNEICRFPIRGFSGRRGGGGLLGCLNLGYAVIYTGGVIRVWEVEHGDYLYNFREPLGEVNAMVENNRHVAVSCNDPTIHLWDFGDRDG